MDFKKLIITGLSLILCLTSLTQSYAHVSCEDKQSTEQKEDATRQNQEQKTLKRALTFRDILLLPLIVPFALCCVIAGAYMFTNGMCSLDKPFKAKKDHLLKDNDSNSTHNELDAQQ